MSHPPTTKDRTPPRLRLVATDPAEPSSTADGCGQRDGLDAGAEALKAIDRMSRRIEDLARAFNLPGPHDTVDRPPRAA